MNVATKRSHETADMLRVTHFQFAIFHIFGEGTYRELKEDGAEDDEDASPGEYPHSVLHAQGHSTYPDTGAANRQANCQRPAGLEPLGHNR